MSTKSNQQRVRELLASADQLKEIAYRIVDGERSWIATHLNMPIEDITGPALDVLNRPGATMSIVGSAAIGFSLATNRLGRPFRTTGKQRSDIDLALVDESVFREAWELMLKADRIGRPRTRRDIRERVYWGKISEEQVPRGEDLLAVFRSASDAVRRATRLHARHEISIRVYRTPADLVGYVLSSLTNAKRALS